MALSTRFTRQFKCAAPIVLAPMAGVSGGELAAAVARAGGFPFIAGGHAGSLDAIAAEVDKFRALAPPGSAWGLGLISYSALGINNALDAVLEKFKPDVMQFTAPSLYDVQVVSKCKAAGAKVIVQVNTLAEALQAANAGVDGVIAQGTEAGGHSVRPEVGRAAMPLAAAICAELKDSDVQVLYAGGVCDGRGVVAALSLGCDAVVMGTRFWACRESLGHPKIRERLVSASGDNTVRCRVYDIINNVANAPYGWPAPFDTVRAVRNSVTEQWIGREEELEADLGEKGEESEAVKSFVQALKDGDAQRGLCMTGEGVDLVKAIESAEDVVHRTLAEAVEAIRSLNTLLVGAR